MGDDVEGDLLGERPRLGGIADEDVAALLEQFVHARLARARDRLVGGDDHPPDRRRVVERLQRHHHLRGRAIGVGDDVLCAGSHRSPAGSPRARSAARPGPSGKRSCCRSPCSPPPRRSAHIAFDTAEPAANKAMSQPAKSKCSMLRTLSSRPLSPKSMTSAGRARASHRGDLVGRELALGEDVQHLAPDIAGRADHDHPITHPISLRRLAPLLSQDRGGSDMACAGREQGRGG